MNDHADDRDWENRPRRPSDEWDDDYRPPRHRYGDDRDDYDEQFGYSDPRQKVRAPGMALMIVGGLGVLGSLAMAAMFAFMLIEEAQQAPRGGPDEAITAVIFIALGGLSLAACVVVTIGGARMRQCRSYGLAMTAAILAIASIALFGLCSVFILPFGIWALIVLSNSDVKREFQRASLKYSDEARDYLD